MNKKSLFGVVVLSTALFGTVIGFNHIKAVKTAEYLNNMPEASMPIVSSVVKYSSYTPQINTIGFIAPDKGVNVNNESAGTIQEIHFESGDFIKKGEVLLVQDASYEIAQLDSIEVKIPAAKARYERYKGLFETGSVSKEAYDEAEATYLTLVAEKNSVEAKINLKRIKAPFDGFTGLRNVQLGEYLQAGSNIVRLENLDLMTVKIAVPQRYFRSIKENQHVSIKVESNADTQYSGYISAIAPAINTDTGLFSVEISIPNESKELRSGMYAYVTIDLEEIHNQIIVPQTSIQYALYGESVYVVKKDENGKDRAEQVFVETGERIKDNVIIKKGLNEGDKVVTNGQLRLSNSTLVHEVDDVTLQDSKIINKL